MEDCMISISKGVFTFKPNRKLKKQQSRTKGNSKESSSNIFSHKLWYKSYYSLWTTIEQKIKELNNAMFTNLLGSLINSIKTSYKDHVTEIPTAVLLTGINMPDHSALFSTLLTEIKKVVTPHVAILYSSTSVNVKNLIESVVNQFVNKEDNSLEEEDSDSANTKLIRKSYCTFQLLQSWYESLYGTFNKNTTSRRKFKKQIQNLVIIIPDFESFNDKLLQEFILIVSSYLNILPIVLIFGVATSTSAVHKSLPYHVSSKIQVQVFNSQPSIVYLNNTIENVFLTSSCPFHIGGRVFNLFTDVFLFYDLSVKRFITNFKFAMLEHFCNGNLMALCTDRKNAKKVCDQLSLDDLEMIQNLPSYHKYQNRKETFILPKNEETFRKALVEDLLEFHDYLKSFHLYLNFLHILVCDLPNTPLGKQIRELYCIATSKSITQSSEFQQCFQLLNFQSKDELFKKIQQICKLLNQDDKAVVKELEKQLNTIENVTTDALEDEPTYTEDDTILTPNRMNRRQLREKLLNLSKKKKPLNKYEKARQELVKYLQSLLEDKLQEPSTRIYYELFFFDDLIIKRNILGSHRAAIHTALNNPQKYLLCKCCNLAQEDSIVSTMPDTSIIFKLHLEYGKLINTHDCLQSFLSIIDPENEEGQKVVPPQIQARFTQSITDLELLGFIKTSKRKTDHVIRLIWGG